MFLFLNSDFDKFDPSFWWMICQARQHRNCLCHKQTSHFSIWRPHFSQDNENRVRDNVFQWSTKSGSQFSKLPSTYFLGICARPFEQWILSPKLHCLAQYSFLLASLGMVWYGKNTKIQRGRGSAGGGGVVFFSLDYLQKLTFKIWWLLN